MSFLKELTFWDFTINFIRYNIDEMGWMSIYDGIVAGVLRQVLYASTIGIFETFRDKLHEIRGKTDFSVMYVYLNNII